MSNILDRRKLLITGCASAAALLPVGTPAAASELPPAHSVSEALARFCRSLCVSAVSMPDDLRERLGGIVFAGDRPPVPGLERSQADRLARMILRLYAPPALRAEGLDFEANECAAAETDPESAAYAAWRADTDISYIYSECVMIDPASARQIVADSAARAGFIAWADTDSDLMVPFAGDYAAIVVMAWERHPCGAPRWLWPFVALTVRECLAVSPDARKAP